MPCLFAEGRDNALRIEEAQDLLYIDPHAAIKVYSEIFAASSPDQDLLVWLKSAIKLNASYFHMGDLDKVPEILDQVLPFAAKAGDPELYAQLLIQKSSVLFNKADFVAADQVLTLAAQEAKASGMPQTIAMTQIYQAREFQRKGHPEQATEHLHAALVSLKSAKKDARYYAMMNNIAMFLEDSSQGKDREALQILAEITVYFDQKDLFFLGTIAYENYANILVKNERLNEAVQSYRKSGQHASKIGDEIGIACAKRGMGRVLHLQHDYRAALEQFAAARPIFIKYKDLVLLAELDYAQAETLLTMGKAEDALAIVTQLKATVDDKNSSDSKAHFLRLESKILERLVRFHEAMMSYKALATVQQDIFDSKKQELSNRYYAEFEMERRSQENKNLEHKNHLQALEIDSQAKLTRASHIALGASFVTLAILGFSAYRVKRSKRKIESLQRYIETNVLQRFLPPEMVQEILNGKSRLDDRTKMEQVTVLFADLCQFTRATDILGPDTISHILNDFFIHMTDVIFSERGTIDKFIGDAIMVIFGAPSSIPPEEQAQAAVRCAQKMQAKLQELNKLWELRVGQHFEMRIGIHQGQAVVGTFGGSKRSDYTVVGTSVNIAARVEGIAEPNSIFVTEAITRFLKTEDFTLRGSYRLRGLNMEIPLFRINQEDTIEILKNAS